jgi:hypothetical protein
MGGRVHGVRRAIGVAMRLRCGILHIGVGVLSPRGVGCSGVLSAGGIVSVGIE